MALFSRAAFAFALLAPALAAAPLSQQARIDFFRDVPSRNLQGLATRSDGRLTAGPVLRELTGDLLGAELLWGMTPGPEGSWFVGTGPQGRILQVRTDVAAGTVAAQLWGTIDDAQVFALRQLPDGSLLAGSSPRGGLHLLRDGQVQASARLPVDSIFDLLPDGPDHVLVGTGNPGRIYRVNLATFAAGGVSTEPLRDAAALAARGIERFGDIRDRNARRLARAADGRLLVGSAPAGKLYAFPAAGGPPELLLDNTRAEITDLRVEPSGDIFALVVFSATPGARLLRPLPPPVVPTPATAEGGASGATATPPVPVPTEEEGDVPSVERFAGRSAVMWIPGGNGFPETLAGRANLALYRLALRGDLLLMAGGDAGELVGYDRTTRRSLTFNGSTSAQLSDLAALNNDQYLVLRNNPAGFAVLDFAGTGPRRAETRRIDLRNPGTLGALRFGRLRGVDPADLTVTLRANRANDEIEGWTAWRGTQHDEGGWRAADLRGRYAQLRLELPAGAAPNLEIDTATLHFLPQNRRPNLQAFRVISPNFGLLPRAESPVPPSLTLGQVIGNATGETTTPERRPSILSSPLVPEPGAQVVYWTIEDADGDELAATFSLRREGTDQWIDLAVNRTEPWVQFDRRLLPDGIYFTRLVVREQAPRPEAERLETVVETDELIIDQTGPQIEQATVARRGDQLVVTVTGRDTWSLLAGIELTFNNGVKLGLEQPADGILDGRRETFVAEVPAAQVANATNVQVVLYDRAGNSVSQRLPLP